MDRFGGDQLTLGRADEVWLLLLLSLLVSFTQHEVIHFVVQDGREDNSKNSLMEQ